MLVIVRPGVIFGSSEGGNVSRLVKAVCKGQFFYVGNRQVLKAGGYVKELCRVIWLEWSNHRRPALQDKGRVVWFNFTMHPSPSLEDYVLAIQQAANQQRWIPTLPYHFLLSVAWLTNMVLTPLGIKHPLQSTRIRKLIHSNHVQATYLKKRAYTYQWSLTDAMADWRKDNPQEWPN